MLKIATKTRLSSKEAIKRAVEFFGPGGLGLQVKEEKPDYARFEGGGGGVNVTTSAKGKETSVELESREWDYQVKKFVEKIH